MSWNEIAQSVDAQLREQEDAIGAELDELRARVQAVRRSRGALRARRQAFARCQEAWTKIDEQLESAHGAPEDDQADQDAGIAQATAVAAAGGE